MSFITNEFKCLHARKRITLVFLRYLVLVDSLCCMFQKIPVLEFFEKKLKIQETECFPNLNQKMYSLTTLEKIKSKVLETAKEKEPATYREIDRNSEVLYATLS